MPRLVVGHGPAVAVDQTVDGVRPGERGGVLDGRGTHRLRPAGEHVTEGAGPVVDVVSRHERAADAVADRHRQPADRGGDHRGAARLRFDRDQPERLGVTGHGHDVGGPVHPDQVGSRLGR